MKKTLLLIFIFPFLSCDNPLNNRCKDLDAFGQIFKKIESANDYVNQGNILYYDLIEINAQEKKGKWVGHHRTAKEIRNESEKFYLKIQKIKDKITQRQRETDPELLEYEEMDYNADLDALFFNFNGISPEGNEFIDAIFQYKSRVIQVFASQYPQYTDLVEERFKTGDFQGNVKNSSGQTQPWISYNYQGFPLISSLSKLTIMQYDIRLTESNVLDALLGKKIKLLGEKIRK